MELRIFIIVLGRWYENVLYYSQIQPVGIVYFKVDYHSTTIRVVEMWLQVLHKQPRFMQREICIQTNAASRSHLFRMSF